MPHEAVSPTVPPAPVQSRRLEGRRILITGAASGIGRATARLFAAEGAALTLLDRDPAGLAETGRVTAATCFEADVTDETAVEYAVAEGALAMGGLDGLVNVAGVHISAPVKDVSTSEFRRVVEVNLTAAYTVVRTCLSHLLQAESSTIVNVSSGQGLLSNAPNVTAYAASKGGVVSLTRALASELAPAIRVNSVCPGLVETPLGANSGGSAANYALQRIADPLEIAHAILFATGPESSYMTGAAMAVDGGRTFH
ncbi:SDR family NAD(P)-dependent oxidoreductase [Streptomyces sp. NPDC056983]|uniref:SDR family NAD(P)-dependent oxidoreductase n=1 Tax=Streptomyces sp. NPDC056983 TaxID=3345987 RepID=UPI00363B33F7